MLGGCEVVLEVLAGRTAVDIFLRQIDEVLLAEAALRLRTRPQRLRQRHRDVSLLGRNGSPHPLLPRTEGVNREAIDCAIGYGGCDCDEGAQEASGGAGEVAFARPAARASRLIEARRPSR